MQIESNDGHDNCLRTRSLRGVPSLFDPSTHVLLSHITCANEPHAVGLVGVQLMHEHEDEPGKLFEHGSIVLTVADAALLSQRLHRVIDVAMTVTEAPPDADQELAKILATESLSEEPQA